MRSPLFRFAFIFAMASAAALILGGNVLDVIISTFIAVIVLDFVRPLRLYSLRHAVVILLLLGKLGWFFAFAPRMGPVSADVRKDLLSRRDYLTKRIVQDHFGPGDSPGFFSTVMQEEWAIGTLSMFGAALANLSFEYADTREEHLRLVDALVRRMLEPDIRMFEKRYWNEDALDTLDGPNGHIGYLGHLNLLLSIRRILGGDGFYSELETKLSSALARRIESSPSRYLETFPGQIFIPDNAVVVASLVLFDLIHDSRAESEPYRAAAEAWLEQTKSKFLDAKTGIIVPWIDKSGQPFGRPRGSYSTWNVFYLVQIDTAFAEDQSRKIRELFLSRFLPGLCGVREYLPGNPGIADVDSGPVVFSLSTSGSGFAMASARVLRDRQMLHCLLATGELVGSSVRFNDGQRYLAAPLIGDAIVLAMRTATKWDARYLASSAPGFRTEHR